MIATTQPGKKLAMRPKTSSTTATMAMIAKAVGHVRESHAPLRFPSQWARQEFLAVADIDRMPTYLAAARIHDAAAARHGRTAARWLDLGDEERAQLEHRNAQIERAAAILGRDRAALCERRSR